MSSAWARGLRATGRRRATWNGRIDRAVRLLDGVERVDGLLPHLLDPEPLDEVVGPLEIVRVLAVVLEEELGRLERGLRGLDRRQQIGLAHGLACRPADDHLPAAFLPHEPDVLDGGLGAVARATDGGHFHFVRREQLFEAPLELDAHGGGILRPEPAEVGADAGLHHAHALGIGLAGRHVEIGPDLRQIFLLHAEQVDALAAGDLHHRHVVLVRHVGDAPQLGGARHAAADARDDRERSVLLNVGVHAVVDEACRAVLVVVTTPKHVEHVAQRRLAHLAAAAVAIDLEDLLHRLDPVAP